MYIIGLSYNTDASACLFKDGKLISAISEERINRKKSWFGVPHRSLEYILQSNGLESKDINLIACHGLLGYSVNKQRYYEIEKKITESDLDEKKKRSNYLL